MKILRVISICVQASVCLAAFRAAGAQEGFLSKVAAHNDEMTALQPTFPTPLVEFDPRIAQYYRLAFSHEFTSYGTETLNLGNSRGIGVAVTHRIEFNLSPPPYIEHYGTTANGFGDTTVGGKFRIASGNAGHGNFIVTALLPHTIATGSGKNGALTDTWVPTLAGAKGFLGHYDVETSLGGTMPTGKIAVQGRSITWNSLLHDHVTPHIWLELEDNATYYIGGSHDGMMQNFVTPAVFYIYRPSDWQPTHPFLVFTSGMQIATSGFHTYNHNLISEVRLLF